MVQDKAERLTTAIVRKDDTMKLVHKRALALLLAAFLFFSNAELVLSTSAASSRYTKATDVTKIKNSNSCPSMQGMAVGSQYIYTIKIRTDESRAVISKTDKDSGATTTFTDASTGNPYFTGLGHANDMAVWGMDGSSHLFVTTTKTGASSIVRYRVNGARLNKVTTYRLTCDGKDLDVSALDIMNVDNNGTIHLIAKRQQNIYTGTVHKDSINATVNMTKLCSIGKEVVYINGQKQDLSSWSNQGFGYYSDTLFVPQSGPKNQLDRSVILVYDLSGVLQGSTIYPTDSIVFDLSDRAYPDLYEIESCDICSGDKKLYFNTNRRKNTNDTDHDGISRVDNYTYSKPSAAYFDNVKHFDAKFLSNGGSGSMSSQQILTGIQTPLRANTYTKTGYTFVGWYAHRLAQDQWYYTNGSTSGWYAKGSQPAGYDLYMYKDQQSVAATTNIHGDTVEFVAQWKPADCTVTGRHSYVANVTKLPTCFNNGVKTYTCSSCGNSYTESIPVTSHDHQVSYIVEPTCTKQGHTVLVCTRCGHGYSTNKVEPIGHDHRLVKRAAATCTRDGYREYACNNCDSSYTEITAKATGHDYRITKTVLPTCTKAGYHELMCWGCGHIDKESIPATGHDHQVSYTVAPTCAKYGYSVLVCTGCGHGYSTKTSDAIDHSYVNGKCSVCGARQ